MVRQQIQLGLADKAATRYLANRRRSEKLEATALDAIEKWIDEHATSWVAVSGGKDSTVVAHLVNQVAPQLPLVWFDSGLEYPQTRPYLEQMASEWGMDLHVIAAEPDALSLLRASGHWEHGAPKLPNTIMTKILIDKPQAEAVRRWGQFGIYGLRAEESPGRKIALNIGDGVVTKHNPNGTLRHAMLAPIWQWRISAGIDDINGYCAHHHIAMHPVYAALTKLGVRPTQQRVGPLVPGWGLELGVWAKARAIAPEFCHAVELELPLLAQFR